MLVAEPILANCVDGSALSIPERIALCIENPQCENCQVADTWAAVVEECCRRDLLLQLLVWIEEQMVHAEHSLTESVVSTIRVGNFYYVGRLFAFNPQGLGKEVFLRKLLAFVSENLPKQ